MKRFAVLVLAILVIAVIGVVLVSASQNAPDVGAQATNVIPPRDCPKKIQGGAQILWREQRNGVYLICTYKPWQRNVPR